MNVKTGDRILDYGCGGGSVITRFLVPLAEKVDATIVGIDNEKAKIEYGKVNNAHPRVTYVLGDILDPNCPLFNEEPFDKIICTWVIQFIYDYE